MNSPSAIAVTVTENLVNLYIPNKNLFTPLFYPLSEFSPTVPT